MKIPRYETRLFKVSDIDVPYKEAQYSEQSVRIVKFFTDDVPTERVVVIFVNGTNTILGVEIVSQGGLHGAALTPRDVFIGAVAANASAIILGHNHPSGDPNPSPEDVQMTKAVQRAGNILGIHLLDHVVVTRDNGWKSFLELGMMEEDE